MLNAVTETLDMVGVKSVEPDVLFSIDNEHELQQAILDKKCPVINVIKRIDGQLKVFIMKMSYIMLSQYVLLTMSEIMISIIFIS